MNTPVHCFLTANSSCQNDQKQMIPPCMLLQLPFHFVFTPHPLLHKCCYSHSEKKVRHREAKAMYTGEAFPSRGVSTRPSKGR